MKVIMHSFAAGRDPTLQWIESPVQRMKLVQKHRFTYRDATALAQACLVFITTNPAKICLKNNCDLCLENN